MMRTYTSDLGIIKDDLIEDETAFLLSWGFDLEGLKASMQRVGQVTPLLLRPSGSRFKLVCGHRRRLAMRELGHRDFTALILPGEISAKDALLLALEENLSHRAFNDAEKTLALSHLCSVIPDEEVIRIYLPLLNLPPKEEVLSRYLRLSGLEDEAFSALAGGELDPESAEIMMDFREGDRSALLSLFRQITPGRNKRREIVAWAHELYKRDGLSVKSLLNEDDFRAVLEAENLNRPEKEKRIRSLIHTRRFPNLKAAQTEQFRLLKKINLSKNLELHPPQNFEGLDFKIQIIFTDLAGFEAGAKEMERLVQNPYLAALIDLG
jgi:hypothetical protein